MTLDVFSGIGLDEALLAALIAEHEAQVRDRLEPLWRYYRNEASAPGLGSRRRLAQESGLPIRITGAARHDLAIDDRAAGREIVIENDIAWRVHTMVDFMFGKPVQILSTAPDEPLRGRIEAALDAVWEASGGISLFQDMALLGHVYGHVDLLVRVDDALFTQQFDADEPESFAELIRIEVIEPTRGFPIVNSMDYRRLDGFVVRLTRVLNEVERGPGGAAGSFLRRLGGGPARRKTGTITEIFSATHRQLYEDDQLVDESLNRAAPGVTPIVHIQNISQPLRYAGLGEVEPLIPLQDELNTRLSDRASRVTMQCFKMYLAKGIEGFDKVPVGPGALWQTDNPDASIEAFGGDTANPSEETHITEIREALDKISGVPPLAAGVVRAKIGNLSSANALRVTLLGLLSKTARKRVTYGRGMAAASRLVLTALDEAGVLGTAREHRGVRLVWPDPVPEDVHEQTLAAKAKRDLGVPVDRVLAELGYGPSDAGVT
ncbi:MAG: phage portal protein [Planctomycetes bacterium]|nr:phage portal protein [Planctomycetota bacterium]